MVKNPPTKQRDQESATVLQAESIRALQKQFEIAGSEYPGLVHVLMLRPETKCDEQLDNKALIFDEKALKGEFEALDEKLQQKFGTFQDFASYKRTARGRFPFESFRPGPGRFVLSDPASSSNLCQIWQYGSGFEYKPDMSWVHFLCHRRAECWNKGRAIERFLTLVELTGGLLAEPTIVNHLGLSQEMQHLTYAIDRWLVALHECGLAKAYNSMLPENLTYMIMDLLLPITNFFYSKRIAYLGAVPDVWVASSLLCAGVLDLAEKQKEGQSGVYETPHPTEVTGGKTKRESLSESQVEYSMPLPMTKWAEILGLSENTLREARKEKKYHFLEVSKRRWSLPKQELPTEYLEKYRHAMAQ